MFIEQITNFSAQVISKVVATWRSTTRVGPERDNPTLGESLRNADINYETRTEPHVPAKNERLSESSLHLSS